MRHCLIPISLTLTLAVALVGCGTEESPELGLEACQSYCEAFFIKYGECVEAMSDDTRSTAISYLLKRFRYRARRAKFRLRSKAPSAPPKKPRSPRWTAASLGSRIRIKRSAPRASGEPRARRLALTNQGTVLRARPQERRDKHPECDLPCRGEIL